MRYSVISILIVLPLFTGSCQSKIDRYEVVSRNNIVNTLTDSLNSFSVGNGEFCYTADITGLQTFPDFYMKGVPLGTMSNWGWYTAPNPEGFNLGDVLRSYDVHGRTVEYVHQYSQNEDKFRASASEWLRANQLRIHLGMIGFKITDSAGREIGIADVKDNRQTLDLWTGELTSKFSVDGVPVTVRTVCHPNLDMISAKAESELISSGRMSIKISFPFTNPVPFGFSLSQQGDHSSVLLNNSQNNTVFERTLNGDKYFLRIDHSPSKCIQTGDNEFLLEPGRDDGSIEISCLFSPSDVAERIPGFEECSSASAEGWLEFWNTGAVVDFSACTDTRAKELERRVVLSRYLTRIQCSGSLPPAETGLTYNSWYGKFHLEMHWWHGVHFALWGHEDVLLKQLEWYKTITPLARATASGQGYDGVRWPKMTDRTGRESPSTVGTYLIWQQPHPIFYAELLYQNSERKEEVLEELKDIVFSTADFMASYAWYEESAGRYVLGPVLIPAQESLPKETTVNPVFELAYWKWALKTAQEWRRRSGLGDNSKWADIINRISSLPVQDGIYLCAETATDSYTNPRYMSDHPIVSGVLGFLPDNDMVDRDILARSLDTIAARWNWPSTWGWDFPMLAMSAAAAGEKEKAVDFLLMDAPKNRYLPNGHNYQTPRLTLYLPGNGGLLTAVAKMCTEDNFPSNGQWKVRWEGLNNYVK